MLRAADPGSARASAGERKRRGDDSNANIAAKKESNLSCLPKARLHLSPLLGAALSAGATGSLSPTAFLKCRTTSWASWGSPGKKQRCQAGGLLLQPSAPGCHWGIGAAAPPKKTNLLAGKAMGQQGGGGGYTTGPGLLELEPWSLGTQKAALR